MALTLDNSDLKLLIENNIIDGEIDDETDQEYLIIILL